MVIASDAAENHWLAPPPDVAKHRWLPLLAAVVPPPGLVLFPDFLAV